MSGQIELQDAMYPRGSRKRSIAMAMAMASFAVVGTAGMAWSALSMALDSPLKLREGSGSVVANAPDQLGQEAIEGFAEGTRAQASSTEQPAMTPPPIVIEGPTLSTRGDAALASAAQNGLFAPSGSSGYDETAPALAVTTVTEGTPRPAQRTTPSSIVQATTTPVATQQPAATTTEEKSRLEQLWTTGVFR
jgi:hypothetical protein